MPTQHVRRMRFSDLEPRGFFADLNAEPHTYKEKERKGKERKPMKGFFHGYRNYQLYSWLRTHGVGDGEVARDSGHTPAYNLSETCRLGL